MSRYSVIARLIAWLRDLRADGRLVNDLRTIRHDQHRRHAEPIGATTSDDPVSDPW